MFETPILLLIFNRPDATQQMVDALRTVKPRRLFVAADGPRPDKPTDNERCQAARSVINQIDWPCTVETLFRPDNRGCGRGPAEAITWFFDQVEDGIVLEDDCVPDQSFFPYCRTLLEKYRDDERVFMISGTNALKQWTIHRESYFFSYMGHSYGWASWRRAWAAFDYEMHEWATQVGKQKIRNTLSLSMYFNHFSAEFTKYQLSRPDDVWDFQWLYSRWANGGKTIVPVVNLIKNIGFNADATHTVHEADLLANLPLYEMTFPLIHPTRQLDKLFDWYVFERFVNSQKRPFWKKILLKAVKIRLSIL
jgi:hypothetical protein